MTARESIDYSIDLGGLHYVPDGRGVDVVCLWNNLGEAKRRYLRWMTVEGVSWCMGTFSVLRAARATDQVGLALSVGCVAVCIGWAIQAARRLRVLTRIVSEIRCFGVRLDDPNNMVRWLPHTLWEHAVLHQDVHSVYLDRLAEEFDKGTWERW